MNKVSYLYDELLTYTASEAYPFHMPGHKRRMGTMTDPFHIDITEIDGFDDLHHAQGLIREAEERAARLYGSEETHFMVNGSTGGILTALSSAISMGQRAGRPAVAMARNAHKSAFHALYLMHAEAAWLYPAEAKLTVVSEGMAEEALTEEEQTAMAANINGAIEAQRLEQLLEARPDIGTVFIVSPTYDGVISDIREIARICHRYGAVLIVDEAHGAHYGISRHVPVSALSQGADLVVHSLHKTMPSLTQTALLHVNGERVDRALVKRFLQIYQSSSPSYVLMSSMDQCIRLMQEKKDEAFAAMNDMLERFYQSTANLRVLRVAHADDPSKILIFPGWSGLTGGQISEILRRDYALELEMAMPGYALAFTSVGDDEEGLCRLSKALQTIDEDCFIRKHFGRTSCRQTDARIQIMADGIPETESGNVLPLHLAWDAEKETLPLSQAENRVAGEFVYLYPPGIPILTPGEQIHAVCLEKMRQAKEKGFILKGMADPAGDLIQVVKA